MSNANSRHKINRVRYRSDEIFFKRCNCFRSTLIYIEIIMFREKNKQMSSRFIRLPNVPMKTNKNE